MKRSAVLDIGLRKLPILAVFLATDALVALTAMPAETGDALANERVSVRITSAQKEIAFQAAGPVNIGQGEKANDLTPGTYTAKPSQATPAQQRFHLFIKTFLPSEVDRAREYLAPWKQQGYEPEIVTFGKRLTTDSGAVVDNRSLWISLARTPTLRKADELKKKLEAQKVWGWIQAETVRPGTGLVIIKTRAGQAAARLQVPARLRSGKPIEILNVDYGFWKSQRENRWYAGDLAITIGPDGLLELYETIQVDDYLAGVLPAEMPSGWPTEALKAQAVAARSEVLASRAGKHMLEGCDFCGTEHCRAYLGNGGRETSTDQAVFETAGVVLTANERTVPAVFSANCGGWTEDNETVWSAPPNPALRGVPDFPAGKNPAPKGIPVFGPAKWLSNAPPAFCSANKEHFRWIRRFSAQELTEVVNKKYPVGNIRAIELGDRGVSGRLKWVKIVGTKKTEIVRKELGIRLALGGLNSAMFMVETEGPRNHPISFAFVGGGRGHGVGLCQDGACAMAAAGARHQEILAHYFPNAEVVRLR